MNDPIELTPFERRLAAALRDEQTTMSDECLDPEALLDDLEHGEDHPRHLAVLRHLSDCAACRHEHSVLSQIWREARNNSIATPPAAATAAMAPSASSERTVIPQASHLPIWDWMRTTLTGSHGARIAWASASIMLLVGILSFWTAYRSRTQMLEANTQLQRERRQNFTLNAEVAQIRKAVNANRELASGGNAKALSEARELIRTLRKQIVDQIEERRNLVNARAEIKAANARALEYKHQLEIAGDDGKTNRMLVASLSGVRPDRDSVRSDDALQIIAPNGTCILEDRPQFQWTLDRGSMSVAGFEVTIDGDKGYHRVKRLPKDADSWNMASESTAEYPPLKRGEIASWHLTVLSADAAPITTPAAKFKVVSKRTQDLVMQTTATDKGRHVALYRMYLENGLLDDARREVNGMLDDLRKPPSKRVR